VQRAERVLDRMRGLLGRMALGDGEALAIAPCGSIHTFFMKFEIDAVFLDRRGRVVRALTGLRPWRATRFHLRAEQVVELPPARSRARARGKATSWSSSLPLPFDRPCALC